ncbi:LpxL/LpxP family Kdo(2)-lipid IV(A) lauroyl/palmitoleoyl acyltransferase [Candidatus Regiella insecticola]|uniref:Lipid A biosynthesis acyltransferase n=1 Tax=Candidatus Regiella insecticola TaxID=138073 RepID=A0A6L2ZPK1_9ENTR|nr:LpxL/LpxP family Kdo(2)-lipid IV(A) lauroyl/palmitoleoyl acyltransferase [Candidatus Regiella insecticola]GFN46340.1 lipid A biosynthesis lauroyltransferase [Candidatus Regiella insecticola]
MIRKPSPFNRSLLHPLYWLTWFGLSLLYLLVLLPYPVIYRLGTLLGRFSMPFLKKRVSITQRNLVLCFPDMSKTDRDQLVKKNFEAAGLGLFETGMAWFWPDWRIKRWSSISGLEHLQQAKLKYQNQGVLLVGLHFFTLELGARIIGINIPGIGVYRPHNNKVMEWIQTWGRLRSNKAVIDRKDLKDMVRNLKQGEIIWYAPDHDYGPRNSVFVPLFAVDQAATTTGSYLLISMAKAAVIPFTPHRLANGKGYKVIIQPAVENFPIGNKIETAAFMNKLVEKQIIGAIDQYMWLHRRFKTRPAGQPSMYN